MQERATHRSVTFRHPFRLEGLDAEQAPGTYVIETIEEPIEGLSFLAYRRISTTIVLRTHGAASLSRQVIAIDPRDLEAAQARDGQPDCRAKDLVHGQV